ncbi:MAG: Male sterility domain protein [Flavipsychrobacter sp.]|jgi:thioester reductase-like protein|nr:Male sterility domain protein [Flavipsychrobacter sp.]
MNIFLTGCTGLVGGELLVRLSKREDVKKIYCLIRAQSHQDAVARLHKVFDVHEDHYDAKKIIPVVGNLFDDHLTEQLVENKHLHDIHTVIHSAANTSFSRVNDTLVEKANVGGLEKVLLWAKTLPTLQTFLYIGTATICGKDIRDRIVQEVESPNTKVNHVVKYTYTKMRGEMLIHKHLPDEKVFIARPSIIMGDSRAIMPRSPVILWAMATINHLRLMPVNEFSKLDIVPMDYTAKAIIGLLFAKRKYHTYHISAGKASTTANQLAKTLSDYFDDLPPFKFVEKSMLKHIKLWTKNKLHEGDELYQYQDYLDYWEEVFEGKSNLRILFTGLDPYLEFMELGQVFDNSRLLEDLPEIGNSEPAHEYIAKSMHYVEKLDILEGAIDP